MPTGGFRAKIHWSGAIHKEPGNYIGWPTIARKADGELLAVFSGDRQEHICPYGKSEMVRSRDEGETWSEPETINNTPLDDRDTGIVVLRSGTVVMSWFAVLARDLFARVRVHYPVDLIDAWDRHWSKISDETRERWEGAWTRRSTDGGDTWEPPVNSVASSPHGPIELRDGGLLYVGNTVVEGRPAMVSMESTDEARSWHMIGTIPVPQEAEVGAPESWYSEPHVVEMPDGRLVCLCRYERYDRPHDDYYLHQSESMDGGRTWTMTQPTPIWGYPPYLVRLHNGDVLVSYGHRRPAYGQRACLSHDEGRTWDIESEIILRDDAPNTDLGYPATIELEPGELLTVYYQTDKEGEKTSLMATRWSLERG